MAASAGTVIKGEPQTSSSLNSSNVRINLDGIFEGDLEPLRVTAQSSPNMTVAVASDNDRAYIAGNTPLDYAGANSGAFSMPGGGGEKQIDLLTLDSAGALTITSGTPTTGTPSPPTYPLDKIVVAEVYLRNGGTVIKNTDDSTNGYIFKARTPLFNLGNSSAGHIAIMPHAYHSISQGTWTLAINTSQFFNGALNNVSGDADGDRLNYKVYLAAGTYTFNLLTIKGNNRGIVDISLDGFSTSEGTIDLYAGSNAYNNIQRIFGIVVSSSGLYDLSLKANGKNGSSSGYVIPISSITLFRIA